MSPISCVVLLHSADVSEFEHVAVAPVAISVGTTPGMSLANQSVRFM
jgi:hypothetical protein